MNLQQFKNMVRFSKEIGFFQHDIRDTDRYADPGAAGDFIIELDRAFIDAGEESGQSPEVVAGFGESDEAMEVTDKFVDTLLTIGDDGSFIVSDSSPYEVVFPEFKAAMQVWSEGLTDEAVEALGQYWGPRIYAND